MKKKQNMGKFLNSSWTNIWKNIQRKCWMWLWVWVNINKFVAKPLKICFGELLFKKDRSNVPTIFHRRKFLKKKLQIRLQNFQSELLLLNIRKLQMTCARPGIRAKKMSVNLARNSNRNSNMETIRNSSKDSEIHLNTQTNNFAGISWVNT